MSKRVFIPVITLTALAFCAGQHPSPNARLAFEHQISHLDGSKLQVKVVEVTYGPGAASEPHTHPCPIIGYVIEGAVRMKFGDAKEITYQAGEGFYEEANTRHMRSSNASQTERARFTASFICDHAAQPLSTPIHDAH